MAPVLQGLFASLLNPANARHGDAVYSQEALDQIISTLMEQHPTSNAPGPASADAIAALPKKKIDEKQLGPEGKAECSVCMDDVHMGDEVVLLPCSHWFHEICAGAWLSEHNTCPICRKGIDGDTSSASSRNASPTEPSTRPEYRSRHTHSSDNVHPRGAAASQRNEARLNSIRNTAGLTSSPAERPRRYRVVGDPRGRDEEDYPRMPGSFSRRHSERSGDHHHESRRGHTSGSDASRDSRRSSHSGNAGGSGNGPLSWIRDRFTRHD
jgi:E3 ubiquitin-protein ligase RNF115/126